jgi:hypothetical protein
MDQLESGMLKLDPRLKRILAQEYPRFSDKDYARRHKALAAGAPGDSRARGVQEHHA